MSEERRKEAELIYIDDRNDDEEIKEEELLKLMQVGRLYCYNGIRNIRENMEENIMWYARQSEGFIFAMPKRIRFLIGFISGNKDVEERPSNVIDLAKHRNGHEDLQAVLSLNDFKTVLAICSYFMSNLDEQPDETKSLVLMANQILKRGKIRDPNKRGINVNK